MDIKQFKDCKAYIATIREEYIYNLHNLIYEVNECDEDSEKYKKAKAAKPEWEKEIRKMVQECKEWFGEDNKLPRTEFYPVYCLFNALIDHEEDDNLAEAIEECLDELIKKYQ